MSVVVGFLVVLLAGWFVVDMFVVLCGVVWFEFGCLGLFVLNWFRFAVGWLVGVAFSCLRWLTLVVCAFVIVLCGW